MLDFHGCVVLIAGGTSGIGLATAEAFLSRGASVVVAGRDVDKGQAALAQLADIRGQARFVQVDVRDEPQVEDLIAETIAAFGQLDILVNSAGLMDRTPLTELEQSVWESVVDTNLKGVYLVCKHGLAPMIARGRGAVVNVASYLGAFGARPWTPAYGAAKAGVVALTRSLALQVGPKGVRVNAVCPAFVVTPFNEHIIRDAPDPVAKEAEMAQPYPLGRLGRPGDIAAAILFLASDEAGWITGTSLLVDGGLTAG
ncbi:MAG: SDR family NAD(P)-dependent oxidoreductase [Anaerolineae bacterium]|jgi:NAD(P)-dependent dehydrogenase (short-subunit alcohol dehydrogenase family)